MTEARKDWLPCPECGAPMYAPSSYDNEGRPLYTPSDRATQCPSCLTLSRPALCGSGEDRYCRAIYAGILPKGWHD